VSKPNPEKYTIDDIGSPLVEGATVFQLFESPRGEIVNLWWATVMGSACTVEEREAVARQLAASQDLLKAVEDLRSYEYRTPDFQYSIHQPDMGAQCKCWKCIETRADAAIARAKGGSR